MENNNNNNNIKEEEEKEELKPLYLIYSSIFKFTYMILPLTCVTYNSCGKQFECIHPGAQIDLEGQHTP